MAIKKSELYSSLWSSYDSILSDMDTEIATQGTKLAIARKVKQGMMQELLTGRIRLA